MTIPTFPGQATKQTPRGKHTKQEKKKKEARVRKEVWASGPRKGKGKGQWGKAMYRTCGLRCCWALCCCWIVTLLMSSCFLFFVLGSIPRPHPLRQTDKSNILTFSFAYAGWRLGRKSNLIEAKGRGNLTVTTQKDGSKQRKCKERKGSGTVLETQGGGFIQQQLVDSKGRREVWGSNSKESERAGWSMRDNDRKRGFDNRQRRRYRRADKTEGEKERRRKTWLPVWIDIGRRWVVLQSFMIVCWWSGVVLNNSQGC